MCKTLVLVFVPIIKQVPYATKSGKLRFSTLGAASKESAPLYLRCGHGMTHQDRMDGYSPVDPFGRPILCDIHDIRR